MTPRTGHIGIKVTDLERSTAFYTEILGLERAGGAAESGRLPEEMTAAGKARS